MRCGKRDVYIGILFLVLFVIWTILIQTVDVQMIGVNGTKVGFSFLNQAFHTLTGCNMTLYFVTDWLGLVPLIVCCIFGRLGLFQLIKRRSLFKVDKDILLLGIYYFVVIVLYLVFEMFPINYRPILIEGRMEASYPSSTTLLVLSVMPTLMIQISRRLNNHRFKRVIYVFTVIFILFMIISRLISGVHWFTDIIGSIMLSMGLVYIYKGGLYGI